MDALVATNAAGRPGREPVTGGSLDKLEAEIAAARERLRPRSDSGT